MSRVWYLPRKEVFFQHIPKCAGRSITAWLTGNRGDIVECGGDTSHFEECNWKNTFTSIRNPFGRLVSHYKSLFKAGELHYVIQHSDICFSEYVHKVVSLEHVEPDFAVMVYGELYEEDPNAQWDMITRIHTAPLTHPYNSANKFEDVIRFENLDEDFFNVVQKYDIVPIDTFTLLDHHNKTIGRDYWQYYDYKTRDMVTEFYKEDLLTFDYRF